MAEIILGLFKDRGSAEDAISDLSKSGFSPKDISIIMKNGDIAGNFTKTTGESVGSGAVSGATTGGIIGGIAGLLIGVGAITLPGIGALLIGGPIAAALGLSGAAATTVSGAVTGALAGGLVGALVGLGVPEEDAKVYEQKIKEGAVLLAVPISTGQYLEVRELLEDNGADQIRTVELEEPQLST